MLQPGTSASGTKGDVIIKDAAGTNRIVADDTSVSVTAPAVDITANSGGAVQITGAGGVTIDGSATGLAISGTGATSATGTIKTTDTTDATTVRDTITVPIPK